ILSPTVSATIGNLTLCASGKATWSGFASLWVTWWLGDGVGALTVAPLILTWIDRPYERWRGRLAEAAVLLSTLVLLSTMIYTLHFLQSSLGRPWGHIPIPLLLWAAFRFGPRGVSLAIAALSVIAIWGTSDCYGPFATFRANQALL